MGHLSLLNAAVSKVGVVNIQKALDLNNRQTVYSWLRWGLPWHSMLEYSRLIAAAAHPDDGKARRRLEDGLALESADFKKARRGRTALT